ncbi:hypothetical protein [Paraburkholderia xenovorans]|uniref:hypothetical protein n=1 Tax=Paraburkholderia xenovorans TaxID=36873 RepID=UPI000305D81C|nr:hypothetical protein [Paraburkholderia xenovorans]
MAAIKAVEPVHLKKDIAASTRRAMIHGAAAGRTATKQNWPEPGVSPQFRG